MYVTLLEEESIQSLVLPQRVSGQYWLTPQMAVEGAGGSWQLKTDRNVQAVMPDGSLSASLRLEEGRTYTLTEPASGRTMLLLTEADTKDRRTFCKFQLPLGFRLRIGRDETCDICFPLPIVSWEHAEIWEENGNLRIRDNGSSNGTFVNNRRIREAFLKPGDSVYICGGLRILIGGEFLSLNNPGGKVRLSAQLQPMVPVLLPPLEKLPDDEIGGEEELFSRSPRFRRDVETAHFTIDQPPAAPNQDGTPMVLLLGPSLTMGMASLSTGIFSVYNVMSRNGSWTSAMPTLIMAASMLLGTVMWPILTKTFDRRRRKKKEAERQSKYRIYLAQLRGEIEEECQRQAQILRENSPTLDDCMDRIYRQNRTLWERMDQHSDFLSVRLGTGSLPIDAEFKHAEPKFSLDEDPLQKEMDAFCKEKHFLSEVPIPLSLRESWLAGFIGPEAKLNAFAKGMLLQLAALHGYDEVKFVFLLPKDSPEWSFVRWFPHTWDDQHQLHYIAETETEVRELSARLEKIFASRNEEQRLDGDPFRPWYLVFALDNTLAGQCDLVRQLLAERECRGFSLLSFGKELRELPRECMQVAQLGEQEGTLFRPDDIRGEFTAFYPDICIEADCRDYAVKLAATKLAGNSAQGDLPNLITFLQLFKVGRVEHLNALDRWKEHDPTRSLATEVGMGEGGVFSIDYHQDFHGPHGLVAGMTGSGKSEFIMTFILSMAVNYHPYEVSFILIDYKGGGMAKTFEKLPHTVGIITNLDGSAIARSLVSIESELARREAVFQEVSRRIGVSNIDIYEYQKLFRAGTVSDPMPHLFIISDEFAELKQQKREFMDKLVSTARIGRSLGVHLILATQKPSGVVDEQIWSNSRCRVCLKVQEKGDSMEMIKRPDAAALTKTGRFYMQVGYNEVFELGQSAWSGAKYIPSDRPASGRDNQVKILDNLGHVLRQGEIKQRTAGDSRKQIDVIVEYLADLAEQEQIKVQPMWQPPLPEMLPYDELLRKYGLKPSANYRPVVGEADDPANQRQYPLTLEADSNLVVYGAVGSGKTTFISTLLSAMMRSHTPEEFGAYLIDFGAETLRAFAKAPHVGDVVLAGDGEKLQNLIKFLNEEMARRRRLCSEYGGDRQYYVKASGKAMPQILVVIHNYAGFIESFEQAENQIAILSRDGGKYGISFLLTAANPTAIRFRTLQNFRQFFVLQMNDRSDYTGILGATGGLLPAETKGRGLFRSGQTVLEFQTAWTGGDNPVEEARKLSAALAKSWHKPRMPRIPILPEKVTVSFVEDTIDMETLAFPVGIDKETLRPAMFCIGKRPVQFILSTNGSEDFDRLFAGMLASRLKDSLRILDGSGALSGIGGRYFRAEQAEPQLVELFMELVHRHNEAKDLVTAGKPAPVYPPLVCWIEKLSALLPALSADGQDKLHVMMDKCAVALGIYVIITDTPQEMNSYSFRGWVKKPGVMQNGLWVGDGIGEQYQLRVRLERGAQANAGKEFGYLAKDGKAAVVKLITEEEQDG